MMEGGYRTLGDSDIPTYGESTTNDQARKLMEERCEKAVGP